MNIFIVIAVAFGILGPLALLIARHAVRKQRLRAIHELTELLYADPEPPPEGTSSPVALPQLEFLRSKYDLDGDSPPAEGSRRRATWRYPAIALYMSATLFSIVTALGFLIAITPLDCEFGQRCDVASAALLTPVTDLGRGSTLAVLGAAFIGAYIGQILSLSRRVLNFELHALAFMRATIGIVIGMLIALIAYRALNGGADFVFSSFNADLPQAPPGFWLGLAFFIGLAPEAGLTFMARQLNLRFRKELNTDALAKALVVPTEAIDGIDSEIAYRLQEGGIYDVQNLAACNPLQLYVETPFGLMQCFDWVLQAQLCLVVGCDRFFAIKSYKIRTIFDLERAVLAGGVPDPYVLVIGELLFAGTSLQLLTDKSLDIGQRALIVRHVVAVMTDDLHVHRLRSVWLRIQSRLSGKIRKPTKGDGEWLYHTVPLPGDDDFKEPVS